MAAPKSTREQSRVRVKKVNNVKCGPIPIETEEDKRPIKGYEIIHELYANIYLCAKKKSGKTSTIYQ